jgi:DNA replication and repair protein RecF
MTINKLSVTNFRNLNINSLQLSPGVNIFHGANAQGKTNLLEAVYFCAFGRGLRTKHDHELIRWGEATATVQAEFTRSDITSNLHAQIQKGKKFIAIDSMPITALRDLFGRVFAVTFTPDDLRLIKAGPAERRRFMDFELCQLSPIYYAHLRDYYRALRQRNALLKQNCSSEDLEIWDTPLSAAAAKIMTYRADFIRQISATAANIHRKIADGQEELSLQYAPATPDFPAALANAASASTDVSPMPRRGVLTMRKKAMSSVS